MEQLKIEIEEIRAYAEALKEELRIYKESNRELEMENFQLKSDKETLMEVLTFMRIKGAMDV
jgi:FtsZ-binding cell division protein ZapB